MRPKRLWKGINEFSNWLWKKVKNILFSIWFLCIRLVCLPQISDGRARSRETRDRSINSSNNNNSTRTHSTSIKHGSYTWNVSWRSDCWFVYWWATKLWVNYFIASKHIWNLFKAHLHLAIASRLRRDYRVAAISLRIFLCYTKRCLCVRLFCDLFVYMS